VEFLDSVLESTRSKEDQVKRETREQLEAFRRQQEEAEKAVKQEETDTGPPAEEGSESWSIGSRKRKKGREKDGIGGVKLRRVSTADEREQKQSPRNSGTTNQAREQRMDTTLSSKKQPQELAIKGAHAPTSPPRDLKPRKTPILDLAAYSSDEED